MASTSHQALSGKRVLVTGGAGFVGSNLVEQVCLAGGQVTVLDDLSTGSLDHLDSRLGFTFVQGCVTNVRLVEKLVGQSDYVAHLAARNIQRSTLDPLDDFQVNIGGTLNVLMAARQHEVVRIVYSSSASVYGNSQHLPTGEDEPPRTFSPYAVSKLAGELLPGIL